MLVSELIDKLLTDGLDISYPLSAWKHDFAELYFSDYDCDEYIFSWCIFPNVYIKIHVDTDHSNKNTYIISFDGNIMELLAVASHSLPPTLDISPLLQVRKIPVNSLAKTKFLEACINSWNAEFDYFYCYYKYCPEDDKESVFLQWLLFPGTYIHIHIDLKRFQYITTLNTDPYDLHTILTYFSKIKSLMDNKNHEN